MNKSFKKECQDRIEYLKSIFDEANDEQKETIIETAYSLERLLEIYSPNSDSKKEVSEKEVLLKELKFLKMHQEAMRLIRPLAEVIPIKQGEEPKKVFLSKEDQQTLIHDFFQKALDKKTFQIFMYIFMNRKYFFHYYPMGYKEQDQEVYLEYYQEPHIILNKGNLVTNFYTICHEIGHGIAELQSSTYNRSYNIFDEIPSMYFEFLSLDFLKSIKEFNDIATDTMQTEFNYYSDASHIIFYQMEFLKRCNFNHYSKRNTRLVINGMKRECRNCDTETFDMIFNTDVLFSNFSSSKLIYSVGKAIEQNLFLIYNQDKEKGEYIFRKLMSLNWELPYKDFKNDLFKLGLKPTDRATNKYKKLIMSNKSSNF